MKNQQLKKTQNGSIAKSQNQPLGLKKTGSGPSPADLIKIGVDIGLKKYACCRQFDGSQPNPPRLMSPEWFKEWIVEQKSLAHRVVVCYEAGLFGFELARWLHSQGIECVVMAPVKLDEANKRVETDKLNARDICSRLDRYLAGNTRALTACRIPSRQEELARHQTRQRRQLLEYRTALQAQGRSLLWQFGYTSRAMYHRWEQSSAWQFLNEKLQEPELLEGLGRLRALILEINKQLEELTARLEAQADQALPAGLKKLPLGMGWLSALILLREVMDWKRFKNRGQISCFSGLVPSEASTGQSPRQGSITKVGNPIVRAVAVEMAWRMVFYQPHCRAVKRWLHILRDKRAGRPARKRAIVAVARVLMVDLWRLATGQTTAEKLGFVM